MKQQPKRLFRDRPSPTPPPLEGPLRQALAGGGILICDGKDLGDPAVRRVIDAFSHTTATIWCTRVGHTRGLSIPPGYRLAACALCKHPVWISPDCDDLLAVRGGKAVCSTCVPTSAPFHPDGARP
jgi:hypothetical protein